MSQPKFVAVIPARGGSKGIPYKNIKTLNKRPLIDYTIQAALSSYHISDVYVSTEDKTIQGIAKNCGAKVIKRPKELATDEASTEVVLTHFVENVDSDYYVLIQCTSPFTTSKELREACGALIRNPYYDSLASFVMLDKFIWTHHKDSYFKDFTIKYNMRSINYDYKNRPRRQDFGERQKRYLVETGSFYIAKKEIARTCRLGGYIYPFIVDDIHKIEIDTEDDWNIVENKMKEIEDAKVRKS